MHCHRLPREDGNLLVDKLFTDLASASGYFADQVLDLGTFAAKSDLELVFGFALTATSLGDGFGIDFMFGAASNGLIVLPPGAGGPGGGDVPEPDTLALLGFAGVVLVLARREPCSSRRRAGAARVAGAQGPACS